MHKRKPSFFGTKRPGAFDKDLESWINFLENILFKYSCITSNSVLERLSIGTKNSYLLSINSIAKLWCKCSGSLSAFALSNISEKLKYVFDKTICLIKPSSNSNYIAATIFTNSQPLKKSCKSFYSITYTCNLLETQKFSNFTLLTKAISRTIVMSA